MMSSSLLSDPPTASAPSSSTTTNPSSSLGLGAAMDDELATILSSEHFSVSSYLNTALSSSSSSDDLSSQRMTELALQLQLQTQTCHEDIGKIGAELQAILPRCAADVGRLKLGLDGLRLDASTLLEATGTAVVDKNNNNEQQQQQDTVSSSLETLTTLHALQANLTRTKEILTAAATWDSTLSSVSGLLATQNLVEAVNALAMLESGERALKGMPHPEERKQQIAHIRQQVSALLAPQLKHALANMHTRIAPLQQCVTLYAKLDKMDALKEEYVKNRPTAVHKAWFDYTPSYSKESADAVAQKASSFVSWLPGWLDHVLSLLTEERRQTVAVFGAKLVPEMTIKVFRECFRPLSSSFKSRLESICSSNPANPTQGSLETICSLYESTLQFLSLAFEAIAGGWFDMVEAGTVSADSGLTLYKDIIGVFLVVAAPFAPYQERLAQLETKYSGSLTMAVAKDIRNTVANAGSSLESLQIATEKLMELSAAGFPIAEGAVARLELLTGGFGAQQCLLAIDTILADNTGELALAIHTLSTTMMSDTFADNFDDSHVLAALDVLKIAGTFHRNLRALEEKTHERMAVLAERQLSNANRERETEEALSSGRGQAKVRGSFHLPDSMSVVEIDSIITKAICGQTVGDDVYASIAVLQRLSTPSDRAYAQVEEARQRLATSCQNFVFDVLASVPNRHLDKMSSMTSWREGASGDDLAYGTLPQQYITLVGEHMLALVQALEPFASDRDALVLANEAMSGARDVALPPWRELMDACNCNVDTQIVRTLLDGKEIASRVLSSGVLDDDEEEEDEENDDEASKASTAFCNAWLDVVGLAVTGRLLEKIMRIPRLSPKGCEHLAADVNYLVNVFSALGVNGLPHPLLSHLAQLALSEGDALSDRISASSRGDTIDGALAAMEERMAAIRGVAASFNY